MRIFLGALVGAIGGATSGMMLGKLIHDLIWSVDMEGDSGYFTVLIVMPLFATIGATLGGLWGRRSSLRITIASTAGAIVGEGAGLLFAIYGLRPFGHPFVLVLAFILGGAVGGAIGAAKLVNRRMSHEQRISTP